jgi:hypothetical protein
LTTASVHHSTTSQQQNSDDDDDNASVSTQSTQAISLTSFVQTTNNDSTTDVNSSLRQRRQRMNTNESHPTRQTRTRYGRRSTGLHRNQDEEFEERQQQSHSINHPSSSRLLSASDDDDDDNDLSSNSKRNRIERSDRRISSVNRPNYKIDSDEHEDDENEQKANQINTVDDNPDVIEKTENNDKVHGKKI